MIISKSPYSSWSYNRDFQKPLSNILPTGVGGVYYPAHIFDNSPLHNINGIKKTCLNADDIWLNFISRYKNRHIVQTGLGTELLSILSSQKRALSKENVGNSKNDEQINLLSNWALSELGCDFYLNIQ